MTMNHYSDNASVHQSSESIYNEEDIVVDADRASEVDDERDESSGGTQRQVVGAAVLGGIAGLIIAGPILGLVVAGGAAAVATSRGKAGKVARSTGDAVSDAGTRLKKFDKKHHITEKTTNTVVQGCTWVSKKMNPQPEKRTQPAPSV